VGALAGPAAATFPGRNGLVVYRSRAPRVHYSTWLYVMRADGSLRRPLVRTESADWPRWSPDGRRIVFEGTKRDGSWSGVMTVGADGSGLRAILRGGQRPSWTPSGRTISYVRSTGESGYDLWQARPDGSRARRLEHLGWAAVEWSPDGTRLAVNRGETVIVRDLRNGHRRVVFSDPNGGAGAVSWSPDSRWLAFDNASFPRCGYYLCPVYRLHKVRADGSGLTTLRESRDVRTEPWAPSWSPDGRVISYCRHRIVAGHYLVYRFTVRPDGSHPRVAARTGCDGDWQALPR
jgi:Tol biopolymer transport system component